ncbi:phosphatase PAP2 family protein [Nocardia caishijiensis]|uniref:Undecaprenyl-diphosphatase n=1 Tax=Nocardia caishijiensis TaxID=184756 RepID=A0ABQ6YIG6_9NOCA|nr:phosphatase PAP2 family protein [Nocardia caishijiensis]KAF0845587.1 undecaprenyl-diphosphatase [Nocardia caishijiensis]
MIRPDQALRATVLTTCASVTALIPLTFPADDGPTDIDRAVAEPVRRSLSPEWGSILVSPSHNAIVLIGLLACCCWFLLRRQRWRAVAMLVVPGVAVMINTWLLKPLWDRQLHDYLAYPSGHTVHLVAVATTFACLVTSARARLAVVALTALLLIPITLGMIERGYHHATDVLGGAAAAVTLAVAGVWALRCGRTRWRRATSRPAASTPAHPSPPPA